MIGTQLSLPTLERYLSDKSRKGIGTMGEVIAAQLLEKSGYAVSFTHQGQKRGDLRVVEPATGEIKRIEVKTARRTVDGKWRFTLFLKGKTDYRHADVVILLAVLKSGRPVPFVIPVDDLGERAQIAITSHPENYGGRWAAYRMKGTLRL